MMDKGNPGALAGATGAKGSYAVAAAPSVAQDTTGAKGGRVYRVTPAEGEPFNVTVKGRPAWALGHLVAAGARGVTSLEHPAPRWAAYIHTLRGMGVPIETVHEAHKGQYPGTHARYVLRATVAEVEGGAP